MKVIKKDQWRFWIKCFVIITTFQMSIATFAKTITHTVNFEHKYDLKRVVSPLDSESTRTVLEYDTEYMEGLTNYYGQPVKILYFRIPNTSKNLNVKVVSCSLSETKNITGGLSKMELLSDNSGKDNNIFNLGIATSNKPATQAQIIGSSQVGEDLRFVSVALLSSLYFEETGVLVLYKDVVIELSFEYDENDDKFDEWQPHSSMQVTMNSFLSNPVHIEDPFFIASRKYYIIAPDSLISSVKRLANWKRQKGYDVVVTSLTDIYENPYFAIDSENGIEDHAEQVRSYLATEYYKLHKPNDGKIRDMFCLLVGDYYTGMPDRRILTIKGSSQYTFNKVTFKEEDLYREEFCPTDKYFSDLHTDLKLKLALENPKLTNDENIYISEVHKYNPDIPIGRLLCRTPHEVENYTEKLILYESYPGMGDMDYLDYAYAFQFHEPDSHTTAKDVFKSMKFILDTNKIITEENIGDINENGIFLTPAEPTGTQIISEMSKCYGYLSWHGHGQPGSITTSARRQLQYETNGNFMFIDGTLEYFRGIKSLSGLTAIETGIDPETSGKDGLDALGNFTKPMIVYAGIPCDIIPYGPQLIDENLKYTPTVDMGRSFTCYGKYGGPALLGNTRPGNWIFSPIIERTFLNTTANFPNLGIAEAISKTILTYDFPYSFDEYLTTHQLIGDPEFEMWLGKPGFMNVKFDLTLKGLNIEGDSSLHNAQITLYNGTDILAQSNMGNYNSAYLSLPSDIGDVLLVSIWKTGFLPVHRILIRNTDSKSVPLANFDVLNFGFICEESVRLSPEKFNNSLKGIINSFVPINVTNDLSLPRGLSLQINNSEEVTLNSKLDKGGNLDVNAPQVTFLPGFEITQGTTITIAKPCPYK